MLKTVMLQCLKLDFKFRFNFNNSVMLHIVKEARKKHQVEKSN